MWIEDEVGGEKFKFGAGAELVGVGCFVRHQHGLENLRCSVLGVFFDGVGVLFGIIGSVDAIQKSAIVQGFRPPIIVERILKIDDERIFWF